MPLKILHYMPMLGITLSMWPLLLLIAPFQYFPLILVVQLFGYCNFGKLFNNIYTFPSSLIDFSKSKDPMLFMKDG